MGALFVYVSFASICAGALFRPVIGIVGYILFVALVPHWLWRYSLFDPNFQFQKYIALATLAGYVLSGFRGAPLTTVAKRSFFGLFSFLLLSLISTFQSIDPARSWFYMDVIYKEVLMAFMVFLLVRSEAALRWAALCIIVGIGWNAFEINMDYFRQGFSTINTDGWAYMNANGYALLLVLGACLALVTALSSNRAFLRWSLLVISLLDLHAIYILESRGGMLGMILSAALICYFIQKNTANVVLLGIAALGAVILAGPSVVREFESSFSKNLDVSAESRFHIWDAGLQITLDYPFLGVGPWAAEYLVVEYYRGPQANNLDRIHLHNLPLEVSTGSGVPALLGYCAYFVIPLVAAYRILKNNEQTVNVASSIVITGVLCGMPGYWIASMFNSGALVEIPYLCMALTVAAVGKYQANVQESQDSNASSFAELAAFSA